MAKDKKSFTAYCDWIEIFEELTDEEAGKLVKHTLRYVNDLDPEAPDRVTKLTFTPIKNTLKRDLKKWEEKREKNRENARKRWNKKNATACDRINRNANDAVSVSDSVSDSVSVSDIKEEKKINTKKRFSFYDALIESGANEELSKDWIKVRRDKKASNTETAFKTFINQVKKSKYDINQILTVCVSESWKGYKSSWDLSQYIENKPNEVTNNEEIVVFYSNVNPEQKRLLKSEFIKLKEKNEKGGYIYTIVKTEKNGD